MKMKFEWEAIDAQTMRARVIGGWLVRHTSHSGPMSMALVPDPKHGWEVEPSAELLTRSRERLEQLEKDAKDPYLEPVRRAEVQDELDIVRRLIAQAGK